MSCELNMPAYQKLMDEDLEWLLKQPRELERDHIEMCLRWLRDNKPPFTTDTNRMKFLAGCGTKDGPIVTEFANVLETYHEFLGDVIREKRSDWLGNEETDDEKLEAFRRMIDAAIQADRKATTAPEHVPEGT